MYKQRHGKRGGKNYQTREAEPLLADHSISVFRLVNGESLASAVEFFDAAPCSSIRLPRSGTLQKPPALNQLEMRESQFNKHILGSVPVQEALDAIYQNVPSIRKKQTVRIAEVAIFGSRQSSMLPVAICFDPESTTTCKDERDEIIGTLESLVPRNGQEFDWLTVKTPHISVGRIHRDTPQPEIDSIIGVVESAFQETNILNLRNAKLHHD